MDAAGGTGVQMRRGQAQQDLAFGGVVAKRDFAANGRGAVQAVELFLEPDFLLVVFGPEQVHVLAHGVADPRGIGGGEDDKPHDDGVRPMVARRFDGGGVHVISGAGQRILWPRFRGRARGR